MPLRPDRVSLPGEGGLRTTACPPRPTPSTAFVGLLRRPAVVGSWSRLWRSRCNSRGREVEPPPPPAGGAAPFAVCSAPLKTLTRATLSRTVPFLGALSAGVSAAVEACIS